MGMISLGFFAIWSLFVEVVAHEKCNCGLSEVLHCISPKGIKTTVPSDPEKPHATAFC